MLGSRTLTWSDGETIKVDQQLAYKTGRGDNYCEAIVTVTEVGRAGCMVEIDQIVSQGDKSTISVGENLSAGWSELEIDTP